VSRAELRQSQFKQSITRLLDYPVSLNECILDRVTRLTNPVKQCRLFSREILVPGCLRGD